MPRLRRDNDTAYNGHSDHGEHAHGRKHEHHAPGDSRQPKRAPRVRLAERAHMLVQGRRCFARNGAQLANELGELELEVDGFSWGHR